MKYGRRRWVCCSGCNDWLLSRNYMNCQKWVFTHYYDIYLPSPFLPPPPLSLSLSLSLFFRPSCQRLDVDAIPIPHHRHGNTVPIVCSGCPWLHEEQRTVPNEGISLYLQYSYCHPECLLGQRGIMEPRLMDTPL